MQKANKIIDEAWLDGNRRFSSLERALQYFKKKGLLDNFVDAKGEIRWAPTPYGLWTLTLRSGSNRSIHKSLKADIKFLKKRGLIHRLKLPNGKCRWWPTAEGFNEGLGAKSGLYLNVIKRLGG